MHSTFSTSIGVCRHGYKRYFVSDTPIISLSLLVDPFVLSFLLPSWRAVRSYQPYLEERDPIWGDDWSHSPSPNIVRVIKFRRLRWTGHEARIEEGRSAFKMLTGKRSLGRPRHRWEDNIRIDLKEIGINSRNSVDSAQDRGYWRALVNAALNHRVP